MPDPKKDYGQLFEMVAEKLELIYEAQTRLQWIAHFIEVDRIIRNDPVLLNRENQLSMIFSILKAICETIAATDSLVPFQMEYLRLDSELRGRSRSSSTDSINGQVINQMLLDNVNADLALLGSVDQAPKLDHGHQFGNRGLEKKTQPTGQAVSKLPRLSQGPPTAAIRQGGVAVRTSDSKPEPRRVSHGMSAIPVKSVEAQKKSAAPSDINARKATLVPKDGSGPAPRPNRTSMLRAQKVGEGKQNESTKRASSDSCGPGGGTMEKQKIVNQTNRKSSEPLLRKSKLFEADDPFAGDLSKIGQMPPRFAKAMLEKPIFHPAIRNSLLVSTGTMSKVSISSGSGFGSNPGTDTHLNDVHVRKSLLAELNNSGHSSMSFQSYATGSSALGAAESRLHLNRGRSYSYSGSPSRLQIKKISTRSLSADYRIGIMSDYMATSTDSDGCRVPGKDDEISPLREPLVEAIHRRSLLGYENPFPPLPLTNAKQLVSTQREHPDSGYAASTLEPSSIAAVMSTRRISAILGSKQNAPVQDNKPIKNTAAQPVLQQNKPTKDASRAMPSYARQTASSANRPTGVQKNNDSSQRNGRVFQSNKMTLGAPTAMKAQNRYVTPAKRHRVQRPVYNQGQKPVPLGERANNVRDSKKPMPLGDRAINIRGKAPVQQARSQFSQPSKPKGPMKNFVFPETKPLSPATNLPNKQDIPVKKENVPPKMSSNAGPPRVTRGRTSTRLSPIAGGVQGVAINRPSRIPSPAPKSTREQYSKPATSEVVKNKTPKAEETVGDHALAPLQDITHIGAAKNPRVSGLKWLGIRRSSKISQADETTESGTNKENVPPSADENKGGQKKHLGVGGWFRAENDKRSSAGSVFSGRNLLRRGSSIPGTSMRSSAPLPTSATTARSSMTPSILLTRAAPEPAPSSPPVFGFTEEQIRALNNRLNAKDGGTGVTTKEDNEVLEGLYFTPFIPTRDHSPTREELAVNPIAVCVELINSASAEQDPKKRENLFAMSRIMVDAVTRSRDAQCASEKALMASEEAKVATLAAEQAQREVFTQLGAVVEMITVWKKMGKAMMSA